MKKNFIAFLLVCVGLMPHLSQAATLDDILAKIELMQKDISELRTQLKGQASGPLGGVVTPLRRGSSGSEVIALQTFLANEGFYSGEIDGTFGWATLTALNSYKASLGFSGWGSGFGGSWRVAGDPTTMYTITTSACKADFDNNGKVEFADYVLLQDNLALSPNDEQIMYDVKVDGVVDKYDIKEWMTQYGKNNFCMTSNSSTSTWLQGAAGTVASAPEPSSTPTGSDWSASKVGVSSSDAWLWDYQIKKVINYSRRQVPVTNTGSSTSDFIWKIDPTTTTNVTLLAQQFAGMYDSIQTKNGKMYLVQNALITTQTGRQIEIVRHYELYKPTVSENQTTSIDVVYEQVGGKLEGEIYINKKPISAYNGVYPKFFAYFTTDAKWMMTMRILNDGAIENYSILGTADNNPESAYTFESIGDSRLETINIQQGASAFNPVNAQDYYNPTTNTITLKPNQGQVVWFKLFQKPPSVFPLGFTGISETKTFGTDFAINLHRNTPVMQNGNFVSTEDQGI